MKLRSMEEKISYRLFLMGMYLALIIYFAVHSLRAKKEE